MPRKAPNKPLTLYRVFIDYEAAGVNTSYSTADKKIYEGRTGLNQKIRAALNMGVHPRFIQVMSITSTWAPAPDYAQQDSPLVLCKECNKPFAEPSDDCRLLAGVLKINEARTRHAKHKPGVKVTLIERPHPQLFMIDELCITNRPEKEEN